MKRGAKLEREHGLEKADVLLLRYLAKHPHSTPSMLGRELVLPRTTVHFRLSKLAERELCVRKKLRNLATWSLTDTGAKILSRASVNIAEMSIAEGAASFSETLQALASEAQPCRVYMFEPSEQTRLFTLSVDEASYARVSDLIKKNDIIVEVLFGEHSTECAKALPATLRSHMYVRPTIAYELSDTILNFRQVILCFKEDTYFFDYQTMRMTHIKSREVTQNYRTIFEHYRTFAKKINFNELIKP